MVTLWFFNIAIESPPSFWVNHHKASINKPFSIAMFNDHRDILIVLLIVR